MRNIVKVLIAAVVLTLTSCVSKEGTETAPQYLDVNTSNIAGGWTLKTLNGEALAKDIYLYIDLVRKDMTFKMYTNIDGFTNVAHVETGRFVLYVDELLGTAVIRGDYDHGAGEWAHRYTITELTKDSMTWTALDDPDFVQIFSRVEEIPVKK